MKRTFAVLTAFACLMSAACSAPAASSGGPEAESGLITGEITISNFNPSPMSGQSYLDEAAALFEQKYPGTKVNITSFAEMPQPKVADLGGGKSIAVITAGEDDEQQKADYINKTGTELMGGGGADILSANILPYYKYGAAGQVEDLSQWIEQDPDFNTADYYSNILDAAKTDDKLYILPVDFNFECIGYDPTLLNDAQNAALESKDSATYGELTEIGAENFNFGDDAVLYNAYGGTESRPSMFDKLLTADYNSFVDVGEKTANFTSGEFSALLETVKDYEQKGYILPSADTGGAEDIAQRMLQEDQQVSYFKPMSSMQLLNYYDNYMSKGKTQTMRTQMVINGSLVSDTDEVMGMVTNASGEVPYSFLQAYAINSNSKNKQTAWAFLKFLVSEEMQSSSTLNGTPIHKASLEDKAKLQLGGGAMMMSGMTGAGKAPQGEAPQGEAPQGGMKIKTKSPAEGAETPAANPDDITLNEDQQAVLSKYTAEMQKFIESINTLPVQDTTIYSIIMAEAKYFFDGSKTADEVAGVIQNKVGLYLNE